MVSRGAQSQADLDACRVEKRAVAARIAAAYREFIAAPVPTPLETLVAVDGQIRDALRRRPGYQPCGSDERLIADKRWARLGVLPEYGGRLGYTGRLLVVAHRRNPRSEWRPYTLYSTVFGETPSEGLGIMPNIKAAAGYESEFPHGPFIRDVYLTTAKFYKDLYMVLRDNHADYKYDCFAPYIAKTNRAQQEARAKAMAIDYYERILRLAPGDEDVRGILAETRAGTVRSWSYCAD